MYAIETNLIAYVYDVFITLVYQFCIGFKILLGLLNLFIDI